MKNQNIRKQTTALNKLTDFTVRRDIKKPTATLRKIEGT
jgi:hypothetical protein